MNRNLSYRLLFLVSILPTSCCEDPDAPVPEGPSDTRLDSEIGVVPSAMLFDNFKLIFTLDDRDDTTLWKIVEMIDKEGSNVFYESRHGICYVYVPNENYEAIRKEISQADGLPETKLPPRSFIETETGK